MIDSQILTLEGVKNHAQIMELDCVEFLDLQGESGARGTDVKYVRLSFIDGKLYTVSRNDFVDNLSDTRFKLRPPRNDS